MSVRFKNEHEQGWMISDAEHEELLRLRARANRVFETGPGLVRAKECPGCGHTRCGEDCECNCDAARAEHETACLAAWLMRWREANEEIQNLGDAAGDPMTADEIIAEYDREQKHADCDCNWCVMVAEVKRQREDISKLQEIALRVKLGQLEVWPDASMTSIGTSLREANAEIQNLTAQLERARTIPIAVGSRVKFPDGTIVDRDETAQLGAEVKRLRDDSARLEIMCQKLSDNSSEIVLVQTRTGPYFEEQWEAMKAKLARVEALPAKWRAEENADDDSACAVDGYDCADELEAALLDDNTEREASHEER